MLDAQGAPIFVRANKGGIMRRSGLIGRRGWRGQRPLALLLITSMLLALVAVALTTGTPPHRVSGAAPPAALLVTAASNTADPFGPYLGEILRAEGFPTFATADVSALTATLLSAYAIVLLGPVAVLSGAQASALTDYVQGGGRLIAMRPPTALAPLFGVTAVGSTTGDGYLAISGSGLGGGFTTTPLQRHAIADNYTLSGATTVATLYSSSTIATPYPAVTLITAGEGQAMLWAYDLAQSVVYTRQSNPGYVGEHDGVSGYRTTDLYAGYVDLNDVPIPQADEQQRLLAKAILDMNPTPLPHLWYFPQNAGAVLVLTGDAHANPTSYYTNELNSIQKYGGHITFYLAQASQPTASDVAAWEQAGHGVGIHPYANPSPPTGTGCGTNDGNQIGAGITSDVSWFNLQFGTAPSPTTRIHTLSWQCWTDAAALEASNGLQMDTNYYAWGPWLKKPDNTWAHGYINGSGLPMQMVDATGHIIPVYQQVTSLVDEQLITGIASTQENLSGAAAFSISQQLIDASVTGGNYAAIMTQFHVDYYAYGDVTTWAEETMAYAQSKGVPIWSADDWLRFTKARAGTVLGSPTWDGQSLSFTATVPSGPDAMPVMVPLSAGGSLTGIAIDGATAGYQSRTVKGTANAVVLVSAGSHTITATYNTPATFTPTPANTATPTANATATRTTSTGTPTATATGTPAPTATNTAVPTSTNTPAPTATSTPMATPTSTPAETPTNTPAPTATSTPVPPSILVGDTSVETQRDTSAAGTAAAFQYTAGASGTVSKMSIYLDASSAATQVSVGLYTNAPGNTPGSLLAQGTIASPVAGTWNAVAIPSIGVTSGTNYWIAVLTPSGAGTIQFRDKATGNKEQLSRQANLTTLPATWTAGSKPRNSSLSAYGG
jgi:hypothetical protein